VVTSNNEIRRDGIADTYTDGLKLINTTSSTGGVPLPQSPSFRLDARAWNGSVDTALSFRQTLGSMPDEDDGVHARVSWGFSRAGSSFTEVTTLTERGLWTTGLFGGFVAGAAGFRVDDGITYSVIESASIRMGNSPENLAVDFRSEANLDAKIFYYGEYFKIKKAGAPGDVLVTAGDATDESLFSLYGHALTTGPLILGQVPASDFTGSLIKLTDDAGSPVTKFDVDASGGITQVGVTCSNLCTPGNGKIIYCSDCTKACGRASSGASRAERLNFFRSPLHACGHLAFGYEL
jgi:hypothetical protein